MSFFSDILNFEFLQNAIIAILFMSITCSIIGAYIVVKRIVFLSGGLTHASFGGIGIAYYMGVNPLYGALLFSVASALGFDYLTRKNGMREDSAIGVLWALGMAIGILFIFLTPGYAPNLMSFLFGNLLTITTDLLLYNGILAALILFIFLFASKAIMYVAFDSDFSQTRGVPVKLIERTMLVLIAVTIVLTLKLVGIMLLVSLLSIPSMISSIITTTFNQMVWSNIIITFICGLIGVWISAEIDIPTGASIIIVLSVVYIAVKIAHYLKTKFQRLKLR
ncbi:MAG: metal ABC transporter permease [Rikenellaceae bacterium]